MSLCRERQPVVERETAIDQILGLCEAHAVQASSDIGANDFIGVCNPGPSDVQKLSERAAQVL